MAARENNYHLLVRADTQAEHMEEPAHQVQSNCESDSHEWGKHEFMKAALRKSHSPREVGAADDNQG